MSINHVVLIGRLTSDPEIRATGSGMQVASFTIAVNDYYKGEEKAYFFDVKAFGKTAETLRNYTKKGSLVAIDGKLTQERWETKEGGEKRSKVVVLLQGLQLLSPKDSEGGGSKNYSRQSESKQSTYSSERESYMDDDSLDSDLPF
ncbi:MAG TPA: single-stranded DNA-binding protein [Spirochaetia bacterium]|nr:MAG: hypothetical protein A2Y41_10705 [Spirochaetes bacterium GWB1_36_13]HCL55404.1 single-stranded DNA-binding protein [Spirochaetia bacterium]